MPKTNHTTSNQGLDLIKRHEGLRLAAYYCPAGKLTVGYGHVLKKNESLFKITEQQANDLLKNDVKTAEVAVNGFVRTLLSQSQFDALVSFVFNIGAVKFKTSTLLKKLNAGDYFGAAHEFRRWNQVRNPNTGRFEASNGLTKRREDERDLFLEES